VRVKRVGQKREKGKDSLLMGLKGGGNSGDAIPKKPYGHEPLLYNTIGGRKGGLIKMGGWDDIDRTPLTTRKRRLKRGGRNRGRGLKRGCLRSNGATHLNKNFRKKVGGKTATHTKPGERYLVKSSTQRPSRADVTWRKSETKILKERPGSPTI